MGIAGHELAGEFAISGGINGFERRSVGAHRPWLRKAASGAKRTLENGCAAPQPGKEAELLKDQGPGKEREAKENDQNGPRHPAGLLDEVAQFTCVNRNRY
jgi:hypothetical protein